MLIIFVVAIVSDMAQQDFDNFKQQIKDWMDSHPEEYDCFEEEMNRKDNAGYQQILTKAFSLVPKYQKIIRKRVNQASTEDISDIETLFSENDLAKSIIDEFEKTSPESIVPAMLSWLYFGKSFERMVERGEEIRRNPETSFAERIVILPVIKLVISRSISLGLRTKADWEKHREWMKLAESENIMEWAMDDITDKKKTVGRKSDIRSLPEELIQSIENFLRSSNSQRDIACLKIALEELLFSKPGGIKAFRDTLHKQYHDKDIHIIPERGIQKAYKELTDLIGGTRVKDLKENRTYIDEIKDILSK